MKNQWEILWEAIGKQWKIHGGIPGETHRKTLEKSMGVHETQRKPWKILGKSMNICVVPSMQIGVTCEISHTFLDLT